MNYLTNAINRNRKLYPSLYPNAHTWFSYTQPIICLSLSHFMGLWQTMVIFALFSHRRCQRTDKISSLPFLTADFGFWLFHMPLSLPSTMQDLSTGTASRIHLSPMMVELKTHHYLDNLHVAVGRETPLLVISCFSIAFTTYLHRRTSSF